LKFAVAAQFQAFSVKFALAEAVNHLRLPDSKIRKISRENQAFLQAVIARPRYLSIIVLIGGNTHADRPPR
jgi:hypothetical protein